MLSQLQTLTNYSVKLTWRITNLKLSMSWLKELRTTKRLKKTKEKRRMTR